MKFSNKYEHHAAELAGIDCSGDGMTRQEFAEESDINNIMARYMSTGILENVREGLEQAFVDVSEAEDYQSMQDAILRSQEAFMALPAVVRDRVGNTPAGYLQFVSDPANENEMRELGLLKPKPVEPALQAGTVST